MLIRCSECNQEVSDKAPACVKCGNPLVAPARSSQADRPTVIEQTSKSYKAQQLVGATIAIVGVVGAAGDAVWGPALLIGGFVWFIAARLGAWWGHG